MGLSDYFSPAAHEKPLNLLLALAVEHQLILYGLDIYGAFITADIDGPIYSSQPEGLPTKHAAGCVWKLKTTHLIAPTRLLRFPRALFDSLSPHLLSHDTSGRSMSCVCSLAVRIRQKLLFFLHSRGQFRYCL